MHNVTLIPGDGMGTSIAGATRKVVEATGVRIQWDVHNAGLAGDREAQRSAQQHVLDSIVKSKVALKGPLRYVGTTEMTDAVIERFANKN